MHLPFAAILKVHDLWRAAGFRFVLATTFVKRAENKDFPFASWRPLNMELAPFHWLDPITVILEECDEPGYEDKAIGVWAL